MNSVELVKNICKERHIPISKLERDCGFSNGYIKKLKNGKFPSDRLEIIANYLDISIDFLIGRNQGEISGHQKEYYIDEETAQLAQEMFEDSDMRALFHMKKNMDAGRFKAHMNMMKELYKLEHPEEYPEDYGDDDFGDD